MTKLGRCASNTRNTAAVPLIFLMALLQAAGPPVRSLDKGSASQISSPREVTVRERGEWAARASLAAPAYARNPRTPLLSYRAAPAKRLNAA